MDFSDDSDDEPLGAKPSGVGSPVGNARLDARGRAAEAGRPSPAGAPRPKFNGDVLGGDDGGGGGGGAEGQPAASGAAATAAGRQQSTALNRARELQLKKRQERLRSQGMAVSNGDGPGLGAPAPLSARGDNPQPAAAMGAAHAAGGLAFGKLGASLADEAVAAPRAQLRVGKALAPAPSAAAEPDSMVVAFDANEEAEAAALAPKAVSAKPHSAVVRSARAQEPAEQAEVAAPAALAAAAAPQPPPAAPKASAQRPTPSTGERPKASAQRPARAESDDEDDDEASAVQPAAPAERAHPASAPPPPAAAAAAPPVPLLDLSDMRAFLQRAAPIGGLLQCHIVRSKTGFLSSYPKYTILLKRGGAAADLPLLAARKRGNSKSSNYLLSLDADDLNRESGNYCGKLRSNFIGTEFVLYDEGLAPARSDKFKLPAALPKPSLDLSGLRSELCAVVYKQNVLYARGPRRMTVLVPALTPSGARTVLRPSKSHDESSMLEKHKANERDADLVVLKNKTPKWNDIANAYVLNFNGRVTQPSVKNFQIVDERDSEEVVIMQFGRVGDNDFTCDFQYPLSPLQAFGIALSSFDYKIACE